MRHTPMFEKIAVAIEVFSFAGLLFGYSKRNRNIMLASALLLWFGGSMSEAISDFIAGWNSVI
jgi:hypothetical protein